MTMQIHAEPDPTMGKGSVTQHVLAILPTYCSLYDVTATPWIKPVQYTANPYKITAKNIIVSTKGPLGLPAPFTTFAWAYTGWNWPSLPQWCKQGTARTGILGFARVTIPLNYGVSGGQIGMFQAKTESNPPAVLGHDPANPVLLL